MTGECECDCLCTERAVLRVRAASSDGEAPPWDAGTPWTNTCVGCADHIVKDLFSPSRGNTMKRSIMFIVAAVALLALAGCADSSHQDAPSGTKNEGPADIINFPSGYRNVAHKCDGPNMVYVTSASQGDQIPSSVYVVVGDPRCKS